MIVAPIASAAGAPGVDWGILVLAFVGCLVAAVLAKWIPIWIRQSREATERLTKWSALAEPLGLRAVRRRNRVTLVGSVAGCELEVADDLFLTYGLEFQLGLRVKLPSTPARLCIASRSLRGWPRRSPFEEQVQPVLTSVGDADVDPCFNVHANAAGVELFARLTAEQRRLLREHPEFSVLWFGPAPWIEFGTHELTAANLGAAIQLMSGLVAAAGFGKP